MRLYRKTVSTLEFCQRIHKLICAGRGETWCENRLDVLIFSGSVSEPADSISRRNNSAFFLKVSGSIAVHIDLSDIGFETCFFHEIHQKFGCLYMQGCKDGSTCRGTLAQILCKDRIGFLGVTEICIAGFLRESNLIQPFQQFQIHIHAVKCILRSVKVEIVHSRNDKLIAHIFNRNSFKLSRKLRENTDSTSVLTDDKCILKAGQVL